MAANDETQESEEFDIPLIYDIPAKNILQYKGVVAAILEMAIPAFKDYSHEEIREALPDKFSFGDKKVSEKVISEMNKEDKVLDEKAVSFDMLFHTNPENSCNVEIFVDIEPQGIYPEFMADIPGSYDLSKRAVYYLCRMISIQLRYGDGNTKNYNDLRKCFGIWLCFDDLYDTETEEVGFARYGWQLLECSPGLKNKILREQQTMDLMEIIIVRAGGKKSEEGDKKTLLDLINSLWRDRENIPKYIPKDDPDINEINEEASDNVLSMREVVKNYGNKCKLNGIKIGEDRGIKAVISTLISFGVNDKEKIINDVCGKFDVSEEKVCELYDEYMSENGISGFNPVD